MESLGSVAPGQPSVTPTCRHTVTIRLMRSPFFGVTGSFLGNSVTAADVKKSNQIACVGEQGLLDWPIAPWGRSVEVPAFLTASAFWMIVTLFVSAMSFATSFAAFKIIREKNVSAIPAPKISHVTGRIFRIWLDPSVADHFGVAQIRSATNRKFVRCRPIPVVKSGGGVGIGYDPTGGLSSNLAIDPPASEAWLFDVFYPEAISVEFDVKVSSRSSRLMIRWFRIQY